MKKILWIVCLCLSHVGFSSNIYWLKLDINLKYSDRELTCNNFSNSGNPIVDRSVYLSFEVESNTVVAAQLSNSLNEWPFTLSVYRSLRLNGNDLKGIQLYQSPSGELFLKSWVASGSIFKWIAYEGTINALLCHPSQVLKTIGPQSATYEFETEGLAEGIFLSYSSWNRFTGQRLDGQNYNLDLQLVQMRFSP